MFPFSCRLPAFLVLTISNGSVYTGVQGEHMGDVGTLVTALVKKQESDGLGSNAFARRLGVDKATWSRVRRGEMQPSAAIYSAAMRVFPDLVAQVASGLEKSNDSDVPSLHSVEVPA